MSKTDPPKARRLQSPQPPSALFDWKLALRDAPDLRWEKVQRIRDAIRRNAYDDELMIDRLLDRFENEAGVLCRRSGGAA